MVRIGKALLRDAESVGVGINKILSEILVCPLTKQPLRVCEESGRLISDAAGVSFPIVDGILLPWYLEMERYWNLMRHQKSLPIRVS